MAGPADPLRRARARAVQWRRARDCDPGFGVAIAPCHDPGFALPPRADCHDSGFYADRGASDLRPAERDEQPLGDADALTDILARLDASAHLSGPPVDCLARAKAKREGVT